MVCVKYSTFHNIDHMTKREAELAGVLNIGLFCGIVSQMSEPSYTILHLEQCDHRHQNTTLWRVGNGEKGTHSSHQSLFVKLSEYNSVNPCVAPSLGDI